MSDHDGRPDDGGYRAFMDDPRMLRSRTANRRAALALVGALLLVVVALALFA